MRISLQRAQQAVTYIEAQLDNEFTLDDIAEAVGVSRFVLQRIFRASIGESLKGYIRKRRLTEAAELLKRSNQRIIELALGAGFASQEAFTRAFQGYFGVTPGHYRRNPASRRQPGLFAASPALLLHRFDGISRQPTILERKEELHISGWGIGADFEDDGPIIELWGHIIALLGQLPSAPNPLFGISHPSYPHIPLTEDQCFAYIAGTEHHAWPKASETCTLIQETLQANEQSALIDVVDVVDLVIPAGLYAVFTHDGPLEHIIDTVNYAWASWLPQSKYDKSVRPDLEIVSFGITKNATPHMELWVAIEAPSSTP